MDSLWCLWALTSVILTGEVLLETVCMEECGQQRSHVQHLPE